MGRVISLQVGRPAPLPWRGSSVSSSIRKRPVTGPVMLRATNLDGDEQADLSVHGGPDKAVCAYPTEHVAEWERWIGASLPHGAFGENLSLEGLSEGDVHIGDVVELGGAVVQVSQPRGPCFKLAARWGRKELPARMARGGSSGWYYRVLAEGEVSAGDALRLTERRSDVTVAEVMRVTYRDRDDSGGLERVLAVPELAAQWRAALEALAARSPLQLREFDTL